MMTPGIAPTQSQIYYHENKKLRIFKCHKLIVLQDTWNNKYLITIPWSFSHLEVWRHNHVLQGRLRDARFLKVAWQKSQY